MVGHVHKNSLSKEFSNRQFGKVSVYWKKICHASIRKCPITHECKIVKLLMDLLCTIKWTACIFLTSDLFKFFLCCLMIHKGSVSLWKTTLKSYNV